MPAAGLRQTLAALTARRTTATALAKQALERAEACRKTLNAFAAIDWDRALKAAADSDLRYAEGAPRSLEGLPIGVQILAPLQGEAVMFRAAAVLEAAVSAR